MRDKLIWNRGRPWAGALAFGALAFSLCLYGTSAVEGETRPKLMPTREAAPVMSDADEAKPAGEPKLTVTSYRATKADARTGRLQTVGDRISVLDSRPRTHGAYRDDSTVDYFYDDLTHETAYGYTGGGNFMWLNQYDVAVGSEEITHVSIDWGVLNTNGATARIVIYSDPNGDGDPDDALLLEQWDVATDNIWDDTTGTADYVKYAVPGAPVFVGYLCDKFFVGASQQHVSGEFPAAIDEDSGMNQKAWFGSGPPSNGPSMLSNYDARIVGSWMVRAHAQLATVSHPGCGSDTREGCEECDGTADSRCPGLCVPAAQTDECTCKGACCDPTARTCTCVPGQTEAQCNAVSGDWMGPGSTCADTESNIACTVIGDCPASATACSVGGLCEFAACDCNNNGTCDSLDIPSTSEDCNGNGVPDECEDPCCVDCDPLALLEALPIGGAAADTGIIEPICHDEFNDALNGGCIAHPIDIPKHRAIALGLGGSVTICGTSGNYEHRPHCVPSECNAGPNNDCDCRQAECSPDEPASDDCDGRPCFGGVCNMCEDFSNPRKTCRGGTETGAECTASATACTTGGGACEFNAPDVGKCIGETENTRDRDMFELTTTTYMNFTFEVEAEFTALVGLIGMTNIGSGACSDTTGFVSPARTVVPCQTDQALRTVTVENLKPGIHWWYVAAAANSNTPCGSTYNATLTGQEVVCSDTCETALEITNLPFYWEYSTCLCQDDYQELCTDMTGSCFQDLASSPDEVFVYTPTADQTIDIDLCQAGTPTKIFVYEDTCPTKGIVPRSFGNCDDDLNGVCAGGEFNGNSCVLANGDADCLGTTNGECLGGCVACSDCSCGGGQNWAAVYGLDVRVGHDYYIVVAGNDDNCNWFQINVFEQLGECDYGNASMGAAVYASQLDPSGGFHAEVVDGFVLLTEPGAVTPVCMGGTNPGTPCTPGNCPGATCECGDGAGAGTCEEQEDIPCTIDQIQMGTGHFNYQGDCVPGGAAGVCFDNPDDYDGIWVAIYDDTGDEADPTLPSTPWVGPTGNPEVPSVGDGNHVGQVTYSFLAPHAGFIWVTTPNGDYQITLDVGFENITLEKDHQYWMGFSPMFEYAGNYQTVLMEARVTGPSGAANMQFWPFNDPPVWNTGGGSPLFMLIFGHKETWSPRACCDVNTLTCLGNKANPAECRTAGGWWVGDGDCDDVDFECAALAACCEPGAEPLVACLGDMDSYDCLLAGGVWQPQGSCPGYNCPRPPENSGCERDIYGAGAQQVFIDQTIFEDTRFAMPEDLTDLPICQDEFGADYFADTAAMWYKVCGTGNKIKAAMCDLNTYDGRLAVYCSGCGVSGICVDAGDDTCDVGGGPGMVEWCSEVGVEYLIMVTGWSGNEGIFELDITDDGTVCSPAAPGCTPTPGGCCTQHNLGDFVHKYTTGAPIVDPNPATTTACSAATSVERHKICCLLWKDAADCPPNVPWTDLKPWEICRPDEFCAATPLYGCFREAPFIPRADSHEQACVDHAFIAGPAWATMCPGADLLTDTEGNCALNGIVDLSDILAVLQSFEGSEMCPGDCPCK